MRGNLNQPEDTGPEDGRQRRQAKEAAALALAMGKTHKQAAEAAGVTDRCIYRWNRLPRFRARVNELRGAAIGSAVNKLSDSMTAAANVLTGLLRNKNPSVKLRAARAVLELATKLRESEELEQRVAELESRFAEGKS